MEVESKQLNQNKQNSESQNKKQGKKPKKQDKSKEKKQLNIPIFKEYYKEILKQEFQNQEQFEHFWKFLQEKLPIAFRINNSLQNIGFFEQNFQKQYIKNVKNKFWDLQQLNWLKNVYIIYQNNPMGQDESLKPIQQKFFKEIEIANSAGLLSRQELVSMLPPLLLDPQPDDVVFDACSAPGSKTTQLLEIMHRKALKNNQDVNGAVISNEMNIDRAYVLSHQINRSGSNAQLVVNHLAQFIPSIKINNGKQILQCRQLNEPHNRITAAVCAMACSTIHLHPE
ncbi:hypothetical protein PPERSA_03863 [Pseudocohnilembus persalinus]|uniref:SAM-dependent MTase RsmB/NOP-type domain-containing protein n=1 Tax=Pseudocohnilembus persalinus TaxID=266149 RepID=A0A0V0Q8Z7_PSEPJ|nr:hypothetical protein PPERSA_03863 [Pseudocohnilembus persalinus]|eukprot:KRW98728.1 hypothetical protein PPERSA_03863 [Pseudocohnilembus persalinus]